MDEVIGGGKVVIGLLVFVGLVAIVMLIFGIIKANANKSSTAMQDSFEKLSSSEFDGYDQVKDKTGSDVTAAIKYFEGRPVMIAVQTNAQKAGNTAYVYGALPGDGATAAAPTVVDLSQGRGTGLSIAVATAEADAANATGIAPYKGNNQYMIGDLALSTDGEYTFNNNIVPLTATGTDSAVRPTGRFFSRLIKNKQLDTVGIFFTQTK